MAESLSTQEGRQAILSAARYAGLQLPNRPRLAPWLLVVDLGDARLQLRSAESSHTLAHPLLIKAFRRIETLLDGRHTVNDIVSAVDAGVLPTTVVFLLKLLQGRGLLQPGVGETALDEKEETRWRRQLRFLSHFVPDASSAQSRLAKAHVGLAGSPGDLREQISAALASIGTSRVTELSHPSTWVTQTHSEASSFDLIVACEESPAFDFFDAVNRACLANGTRWLRVSISGTLAQLGPTVVPYQTACYMCLDFRQRTHQSDLDGYLGYRAQIGKVDDRYDEGSLVPLWSALANQVAVEVMRLLIGFTPPVTIGRIYEFNAVSPVAISHDVLRVPRCESCGRRRTFAEAWDQGFMPTNIET